VHQDRRRHEYRIDEGENSHGKKIESHSDGGLSGRTAEHRRDGQDQTDYADLVDQRPHRPRTSLLRCSVTDQPDPARD
jgi:hypothetical protein